MAAFESPARLFAMRRNQSLPCAAVNNNTAAHGSDWFRRIANNLAGDSNAAIGDQALCLGARREAKLRERTIQPNDDASVSTTRHLGPTKTHEPRRTRRTS